MDRLTIRTVDSDDIVFAIESDPEGAYDITDVVRCRYDHIAFDVARRLAEYEDTGFTPEEIKKLAVQLKDSIEEARKQGEYACEMFDGLKAQRQRADKAEAERDKAIEDIKCISVCDSCKRDCQGNASCIDNRYMDFKWRGLEGRA